MGGVIAKHDPAVTGLGREYAASVGQRDELRQCRGLVGRSWLAGNVLGMSWTRIQEIATLKRIERGAFSDQIFLEHVD